MFTCKNRILLGILPLLGFCALGLSPAALAASPSPSAPSNLNTTWQLLTRSPVLFVVAILLILVGLVGTVVVLGLLPRKRK